jgi:tetratricopeptide (TPR) repeat protein
LLQARLAQFHYDSQDSKSYDQVGLALIQHLAGDTAGARVTAEQARNTLDQLYRDQPDNASRAMRAAKLSQAYAVMGQKGSALEAAERAIILYPRAEDAVSGPYLEERLAVVQTICGENSRAIATLAQLLQTPYKSWVYVLPPITPAIPLSKNSARKSNVDAVIEQLDLLNDIFGGEGAAHSPRYGDMGAHSPQCEDTAAARCC